MANSIVTAISYVNNNSFLAIAIALLIFDAIFGLLIIERTSYTEIDWMAYMQQVRSFIDGERNYELIRGDTGPLVYPAGFLYIFSIFYWITANGWNIRLAQYIFFVVYMLNLAIVLALYTRGSQSSSGKSQKFPARALVILVLSKRIHSIYCLRMFNDCIAVLLGYAAIYLFTSDRWRMGSLVYSLSVSVKMNMLLHAPGVLLVLLLYTGVIETTVCLSICAVVQVLLGLPFLIYFPIEYLTKSFELGRVFMYKWTVNFKFLQEELFVNKQLSLLLLLATVIALGVFAAKWLMKIKPQFSYKGLARGSVSAHFVICAIFTSNFIGIAFARSLHYQFYSWYFHTLPYLLIGGTTLSWALCLMVLAAVELAFNIYPATPWSSLLLQAAHATLLLGLYFGPVPNVIREKKDEQDP